LTTPNIATGVTERQKPNALGANVVFRFEGSLVAGAALVTPIFELVRDGFPLNQVEVGASLIVPVRSPLFRFTVFMDTTIGMQLSTARIQDNGSVQTPFGIYFAHGGGAGYDYQTEYEATSRRVRFTIINSPMGGFAAGGASTTRLEILNGEL
jgi:hypothetical protein